MTKEEKSKAITEITDVLSKNGIIYFSINYNLISKIF